MMQSHNVSEALDKVQDLVKKYEYHQITLKTAEVSLQEEMAKHANRKKAQALIQEVAKSTQEQLKGRITKLVNHMLRSVFEESPEFVMNIETKRGKTECDLLLSEDGNTYKPIDGSGGGVLDVISFALRVVLWSFTELRNTLVLDEPFKFVSPGLSTNISNMLSEISEKLNLQIIMVSHQTGVNAAADVTYEVVKLPRAPSIVSAI